MKKDKIEVCNEGHVSKELINHIKDRLNTNSSNIKKEK